jgi:hypothetical protein
MSISTFIPHRPRAVLSGVSLLPEARWPCLALTVLYCRWQLALILGATDGTYIAGGILLRFKEAFASSPFRERFEDKGRFQDYLRRIPTHLILEELPALLGLANLPLEP